MHFICILTFILIIKSTKVQSNQDFFLEFKVNTVFTYHKCPWQHIKIENKIIINSVWVHNEINMFLKSIKEISYKGIYSTQADVSQDLI